MKINEYQRLAMRTASNEDGLLNGALGLCGEAGEVADIIKKHKFQGHELDKQEVAKELGDICWYIARICTEIGVSLEEVMQCNIEKLRKRYPNGFDADRSINRAE